jgi:hypothetical protein
VGEGYSAIAPAFDRKSYANAGNSPTALSSSLPDSIQQDGEAVVRETGGGACGTGSDGG